MAEFAKALVQADEEELIDLANFILREFDVRAAQIGSLEMLQARPTSLATAMAAWAHTAQNKA